MCKGADSVITERLCASSRNSSVFHQTSSIVNTYAEEGLRTLFLAEKFLDEDEYNAWQIESNKAKLEINNREEKLKEKWGQELARRQDRVVENQKAEANNLEKIFQSEGDDGAKAEKKSEKEEDLYMKMKELESEAEVEHKKDHDVVADEHAWKE